VASIALLVKLASVSGNTLDAPITGLLSSFPNWRNEMTKPTKTFEQLLAQEERSSDTFRAEWQRLAPAREFAATLLRYRAEHSLSQRALASELGVSQPRVAKLESAEHNPELDTIINAVRRLGIEFVLDVAPTGRQPAFLNARGRKQGAISHDRVTVLAAAG
jgi:DNA-binding XRE family transcriptional regulator